MSNQEPIFSNNHRIMLMCLVPFFKRRLILIEQIYYFGMSWLLQSQIL